MSLQTDFTIDYGAKTVTHTANTNVYTVLTFFQWLAAEFAAASQMDDDYAFVSDTPTVYRWVNGWGFGNVDEDYKFLYGGGISSSGTVPDYIWSNVYSIGSQVAGTQIAIFQNDAEIPSWWGTDNIDVLIKVKSGGTWIQSDDTAGVPQNGGIWVYARSYTDLYDHNFTNLGAGGRNPVGVNTSADSGVTSVIADASIVAVDLSIGFGAITRNLNNGAGLRPYQVEIDCSQHTMVEVYEALKFVTRYGSLRDLNGDAGQEYRSASEGDWSEVKVAPFGTLAGTTVYGARGVWFSNYNAATFVLKDSTDTIQSPPNYQKVTANHTSLAGCNIFVAEVSLGAGSLIWKNMYTIEGAPSTDSINVTATIITNRTPTAGSLRVADTRYTYASFEASAFLGISPDPSGKSGVLYVPLLDGSTVGTSLPSDNIIYSYNIPVRTVVRKYGFQPYTADTVFGATGLTFSPILATDPQAS